VSNELKAGDVVRLMWTCRNCGGRSVEFFCPRPRCEALRRLHDPSASNVLGDLFGKDIFPG
jgi:hypothetical protein